MLKVTTVTPSLMRGKTMCGSQTANELNSKGTGSPTSPLLYYVKHWLDPAQLSTGARGLII